MGLDLVVPPAALLAASDAALDGVYAAQGLPPLPRDADRALVGRPEWLERSVATAAAAGSGSNGSDEKSDGSVDSSSSSGGSSGASVGFSRRSAREVPGLSAIAGRAAAWLVSPLGLGLLVLWVLSLRPSRRRRTL